MSARLKGKVAFITGIGSCGPGWGTGKAIATTFAREGARIYGLDINAEAAAETKAMIQEAGGECAFFEGDATSSSDVAQAVRACMDTYGRVDTLVNNIGIGLIGGAVEQTEEDWDKSFAINVTSAFYCSKHCIPLMIEGGGGSIINISSIASQRFAGVPVIAYAGSKAALNQITRQIAIQYARQKIRANSILVGMINTPMMHKTLTPFFADDIARMVAQRDETCPGGKMGDAHDIAYAAVYLASDEAKFVSGIDLPVDGGLSCQVAPMPR